MLTPEGKLIVMTIIMVSGLGICAIFSKKHRRDCVKLLIAGCVIPAAMGIEKVIELIF